MTSRADRRSLADAEMTEADVCAMLEAFSASGATRLEVRHGKTVVGLSRPQPLAAGQAETARAAGKEAPQMVLSPAIGLFEAAGQAAGSMVSAGEILGHIRMFRKDVEVKAPLAGRLATILGENGSFVEYKAPLFQLSPDSAQGEGRS